jgi:superfamily II DNA or RNA helicase
MSIFEQSFKYKVIYIFEINDELHKGLLKIGDATLKTNKNWDDESLNPNSKELNEAAKERIKQYTNTAGITANLIYTELAVRIKDDDEGNIKVVAFRDHEVHEVLENSGYQKAKITGTTGKEWYKVDLNTAVKAIDSVKRGFGNLSNSSRITTRPIVFRPEQEEAISKTVKRFKDNNKMLWNAKMRFGKTLCALEVVKRLNIKRTIILTHRPVVDFGWYDDFTKIFNEAPEYIYGSKNQGNSIDILEKSNKNYVYFASMQDLGGSNEVGGKFNKNDKVFSINWDLVIVDEAHEGTQTNLGNEIIKSIVKDGNNSATKFLALSGTPFNILDNYDEESIYTWDYMMEQEQKNNWSIINFGDYNPYEDLPELKIYTYDLGNIIKEKSYIELDDKAFNFKEFFRTWTGNVEIDGEEKPVNSEIGDFVHEKDILSFLNLISKDDINSKYPYSSKEYRDIFKHSLWMVPGVKEAKALSKMLKNHPIFGLGFNIINVAGEGDDDVPQNDALKMVNNAIAEADKNNEYTITLSCGKLTTGVTIPEWTAVMMMSGSSSTSAANYLQTIFRVQSPCNKNGKIKTCAYVFDFAPDRTLKMVAESVKISSHAGKTKDGDRVILGKFLNYCPVISINGTEMVPYSSNHLLQQLKRAYAEKVVKNGFDDSNIYNDELLKLNEIQLKDFEDLKAKIGSSKAAQNMNQIDINKQGFTDEEYEEKKRLEKKPSRERTPEEQARIDELNEKNKTRRDAISILRGISIRMPLLIYGADVDISEDIKIENLPDIVDNQSWDEFMPQGVTKELFKKFIPYYDQEIFVAAGHNIRNAIKSADELSPLERTKKVAMLFSCFRNPDKETVLTPWRVVNMHMSDCIGGYKFYDDNNADSIETPKFINQGKVTQDVLCNENAKILEINSKTGLYPLYVAYSIYKYKADKVNKEELTKEKQEELWNEVITNNIYVICKTPMAKRITQRTLIGFETAKINAHYFDDIINYMKNKPDRFIEKITKKKYWDKGDGKMKFDAIIGNPPYQVNIGKTQEQQNATPIYNLFVDASIKLQADYISMIMPSRWMTGGRFELNTFRSNMLKDNHLIVLHDYINARECFSNVEIKGGVCYFLRDSQYIGKCNYYLHRNGNIEYSERYLNDLNVGMFVRDSKSINIIKKVISSSDFESFEKLAGSQTPFGIVTSFKDYTDKPTDKNTMKIYGLKYIGYTSPKNIKKNLELAYKYKVYAPKAVGSGNISTDRINSFVPDNPSICTQTYIIYGPFETEYEAKNLSKYMHTKFFHFLLGQLKNTMQMAPNLFKFVPIQDFSYNSDIDWTKSTEEIDIQLFKKYRLTEEEINYIENKIKTI